MLNVLFSTRNGGHTLGRVLDGYSRCTPPLDGWRMIVVDNGSSDSTPDLLSAWSRTLPLTVATHQEPGKNGALNHALSLASGDFLVFTDDDAVPASDFLLEWDKMRRSVPEFSVFGGTIEPVFPAPLPPHLTASTHHFDVLYAQISLPSGPMSHTDVYGPNMAIRAAVFTSGLRFNEEIGPNATIHNYAMGSESELCDRLSAAGHKFWFNSGAHVSHLVRSDQMTGDFFTRRAYKHGLGVGMRHNMEHSSSSSLVRRAKSLRWAVEHMLLKLRPCPSLNEPEVLWTYQWELGYTRSKSLYNNTQARHITNG